MDNNTPRRFKFFDQFTPAQLAASAQASADGLKVLLARAERTGKPVNGFTADTLRAKIATYERMAQHG